MKTRGEIIFSHSYPKVCTRGFVSLGTDTGWKLLTLSLPPSFFPSPSLFPPSPPCSITQSFPKKSYCHSLLNASELHLYPLQFGYKNRSIFVPKKSGYKCKTPFLVPVPSHKRGWVQLFQLFCIVPQGLVPTIRSGLGQIFFLCMVGRECVCVVYLSHRFQGKIEKII